MSYYVYVHVFPNGKHYVGITSQLPTYRWRKDGNGYKHQTLVYRAIQKYGWNNIEHCILEYDLTEKEACDREIHYISLWKSDNPEFGYNCNKGGDKPNLGKKLSKETRDNMKGNRNHHTPHSEETKQYLSQINMGNKNASGVRTEEQKKRMSEAHKGHVTSEKTKKILSERTKAYWAKKHKEMR